MATSKKPTVETLVLNRIATEHGCTTVGLLSSDLKVKASTVDRVVNRLIETARVERAWDGVGLTLTDTEVLNRRDEADFRSFLGAAA